MLDIHCVYLYNPKLSCYLISIVHDLTFVAWNIYVLKPFELRIK